MTLKRMPLSELRLAEINVRRHTDKQISEYVRSLRMFGQVKPIVIDDTGEIICGNGLYLALEQMGAAECDCYVMDGLTDAQKKKLMLADNRVYELGVTDTSAFEDIVRALGDDIDVPGWDEALLSVLSASTQDVDDMVSGYGTFSPNDTSRIQGRQPISPAQDGDTAPYQQLQPIFQPIQSDGHIASLPETQAAQTGNEGQIERYVVCPKCGERICL